MSRLRPPAVAGLFYPQNAAELRGVVEGLLAEAERRPSSAGCRAVIAPHAGYVYSGPIAACAFAALSDGAVDRVVILGPSHFVPARGLVLPEADALATPLGAVALDEEGVRIATGFPQVTARSDVHEREHSIEVELPFVQVCFPRARVVPLAVGVARAEEVAEVIVALAQPATSRVIVSSDLSHYLPYESARATDAETAERILRLQPLSSVQACGVYPLNGMLDAAAQMGLRPRTLDLRNSGDTAGDRRRVVGYGAFAFEEVS